MFGLKIFILTGISFAEINVLEVLSCGGCQAIGLKGQAAGRKWHMQRAFSRAGDGQIAGPGLEMAIFAWHMGIITAKGEFPKRLVGGVRNKNEDGTEQSYGTYCPLNVRL